MAGMLSCPPREKRAGTLYSRTLLTSIDLVTGGRLAVTRLIGGSAQPGGRRLSSITIARRARAVRFGAGVPRSVRRILMCEADTMHSIQVADQTYVAAD